jgi:hypothetical protein
MTPESYSDQGQPSKALSSTMGRTLGIVTCASAVQSLNAHLPIRVSESVSVIEVSATHL